MNETIVKYIVGSHDSMLEHILDPKWKKIQKEVKKMSKKELQARLIALTYSSQGPIQEYKEGNPVIMTYPTPYEVCGELVI